MPQYQTQVKINLDNSRGILLNALPIDINTRHWTENAWKISVSSGVWYLIYWKKLSAVTIGFIKNKIQRLKSSSRKICDLGKTGWIFKWMTNEKHATRFQSMRYSNNVSLNPLFLLSGDHKGLTSNQKLKPLHVFFVDTF